MRRTRLNSSSNLMFGGLGNGLTVYDKSHKDGNDYLEIAHITTSGMIKYYADVNDEERTAICKRALLMQDEWLNTYGQDYGSTADAQRRLKEAQENAYNAGYEYPDNVAVNASRLSAKTQRAIRHCINSARRRAKLNCGVTRYAGDEEYQTYYFITADNSFVASFDVEIHENEIEFAGFMRGYSAGGYVVNENSVFGDFAPGTDVAQALADFVYDKTGVAVYETDDAKEFINQLRNINTIFTNSRRAALKANRRLNCGYYYDGEDYSEMGYDKEQDAYYDLPDEMYIFKLDLSQLADLVHNGIVSKHEIHEWIDELSEDWGGMPAWSPAKLVDKFEIQDLTEDEYYTWKDNFSAELARFADAVTRR